MGLKPNEIWDMELWEFNNYIIGYKEKIKEKEKNIVKAAYYTASFNNSKKTKKLSYYIKNIDNADKKIDRIRSNKKIDFAKEMSKKIELGGE